jgi:hypothetical protein
MYSISSDVAWAPTGNLTPRERDPTQKADAVSAEPSPPASRRRHYTLARIRPRHFFAERRRFRGFVALSVRPIRASHRRFNSSMRSRRSAALPPFRRSFPSHATLVGDFKIHADLKRARPICGIPIV